jgi:hypothetical protein
VKYLTDIKKIKRLSVNIEEYNEKIIKIKGHSILFPLNFYKNKK